MSREPGGAGNPARAQGSRAALMRAAGSLVVAIVAGAVFLYGYWSGRGTAFLGICLALSLGGVGIGLVFWAHGLMPDEEISEDRGTLSSTEAEIETFRESLLVGEHKIGRRHLLGWMLGAAISLLALGSVSFIRSLGRSPLPVLFQTVWRNGTRVVTADGKPVGADTVTEGTVLTVYPEGDVNPTAAQTLLLRVDPAKLRLPAGRSGWTPGGLIAFSKICTHAGCPVAQYEKSDQVLLCPCHQSAFDVLRGAAVLGGPAGRALPQLPLVIDSEGFVRAGGDFSQAPGPEFWSKS